MTKNRPSVRFFGMPSLKSGYGNATTALSEAFSLSKINTSFIFPKKVPESFRSKLNNYNGKCNIDFFIHTPPFSVHKSNHYKIGYFYWETDTLPVQWRTDIIRGLDEIWAPCKLVKDACLRAGFKGPIEIVPTPLLYDINSAKDMCIPSPVSKSFRLSDEVFKFYSIFQWHKRKGYQELLRAYFSKFSSKDNVILMIKTNPISSQSETIEKIKFDILTIKNNVNKKDPPKVFLITKFLSKLELASLHDVGDCFVLPHKGEGWGMPIHEAMAAENHIITTKYGGITEYLNDKNANIISHNIGPVRGMEWSPLYRSDQNWAYPSWKHLGEIMRNIYNNPDHFSKKCSKAKDIADSFSIEKCSETIEEILLKKRFR